MNMACFSFITRSNLKVLKYKPTSHSARPVGHYIGIPSHFSSSQGPRFSYQCVVCMLARHHQCLPLLLMCILHIHVLTLLISLNVTSEVGWCFIEFGTAVRILPTCVPCVCMVHITKPKNQSLSRQHSVG